MLRQFGHPGGRICSVFSPQVTSVRERNKYQGKKDKNFDTVKWEHQNVPLQPHEDFEPDEWSPRRLTYYPEGLWSSLVPRPKPAWYVDRRKPIDIETLNPREKEWNDEPIYPEIIREPKIAHFFKTSYLNRAKWYKELSKIPEIDRKNVDICKITRLTMHLDRPYFQYYDGVQVAQNITRTHLVDGKLPESYYHNDVDESLVVKLKSLLLDSIRVNKYSNRSKSAHVTIGSACMNEDWENRIIENNLLQEINYSVSNVLLPSSPHLLDLQVDVEAFDRSWWYAHQLPRPEKFMPMLWRSQRYEKIDQLITYGAVTPLQIRTSSPLPRVVSGNDELSSTADVPILNFHPVTLGSKITSRYPVILPGFWPERNHDLEKSEPNDFPYMMMFGLHDLETRKRFNNGQDFKDEEDVVKCKAMLGSFAWLNGLAFYHGFTPFHEITYPFVTQGLVTDGQKWHFYVYQMNSHSFHSDLFTGDGPRNICWISPEMKLYQSYEDGQFIGVNDDVVKYLIKMYSKVPCKEPNVDYRTFVGKDLRTEEEINVDRAVIGERSNNIHDNWMWSYKNARYRQLYHKLFVDNPDYDTTMMRIAMRPRLKPAEDYYYRWKY
ncbi:28S ribosomal protein S30, mitochondrial [Tetranychus urticae]|uniref:Ribosomal protein S30 n=1 Tax=Tetranychus urticae TaxID=32264 RepID=T1KZD2_TETUR|nr:28S ribosomal protein S30, mitochondrial [Tetranychus urticae]